MGEGRHQAPPPRGDQLRLGPGRAGPQSLATNTAGFSAPAQLSTTSGDPLVPALPLGLSASALPEGHFGQSEAWPAREAVCSSAPGPGTC